MELATLFSELYDRMPEEPFRSGSARRVLESADARAREIAREVLDGSFSPDSAAERLAHGELDWKEHFALILGLDRAFANVHPFLTGFRAMPTELAEIKDRCAESGALGGPEITGQLLPRLGAPGSARLRLETVADALRYVIRVPETRSKDVCFKHVGNDAADGESISRREVRVACVPMVEAYEELEISPTGTRRAPAYRIRPCAGALAKRVESVLRLLDESGAAIGFLPESTLDDRLLAVWQAAIGAAQPPPGDSRLRWIVCGTGPLGDDHDVAPPNRAVVLDRDDPRTPVWIQDKRFRFTMEPANLDQWGLAETLGPDQTTEDIHLGNHTVVVDCAFGRVAITVCEDLARLSALKAPLDAWGVSLVLAPVFSKELRQHYWEDTAGKFYVGDGATVVVCNSLAVVAARGLAPEPDPRGHDTWGTALARWPSGDKLERSASWNDVRVLRFPIRIPDEPD